MNTEKRTNLTPIFPSPKPKTSIMICDKSSIQSGLQRYFNNREIAMMHNLFDFERYGFLHRITLLPNYLKNDISYIFSLLIVQH